MANEACDRTVCSKRFSAASTKVLTTNLTDEDVDTLAVAITPQAKVELTIDEVKHFHGNQGAKISPETARMSGLPFSTVGKTIQ
ncbi:hypothetical protein [Coleofasciculus sp. E1-EBD-02]|uniref:hypothetical protein n=1 Tax=Coleofasciculus sp. E1-EBD-02 TaxID=3068481 RepID=UPI0032F695AA